MARSFADASAICCVLPVLWMTSRMGRNRTDVMFRPVQLYVLSGVSAVSDCVMLMYDARGQTQTR